MRKWMAGVLLGVACCGMAAAQEIPNPLKRALRGLFGKPQVQEEEELTHRNRRTEDRRAPYSVEQAELFERGDQRWKQGDYGGAFPIFQQVLEGGEDCLVPVGVGQKVVWRSVRDEIEERLRGAGGEVEQSYRELYGGVAERLLQAGDEGEGSSRWAEVAVRYFATSSGQEGADRLASWHLDRGEVAAAGRWLKKLSAAKSRVCESTGWKLKAIWVARQLGDQKWGEELVASLEGVDEGELVLGGQPVGLEELKSGKILTGIDRSVDDRRTEGMGEPTLYQRWSGKLCESEQLAGLIKRNYVSRGERQLSTRCAFEPLVVGDKVVTRGWRGVEVRDRLSGQLLWRGADRHPPEAIFTDMFKGSSTDGERLMRMDSMFFPAISQMFGHEEEVATDFLLAGMWLFYDRNGGIVSSDGSRLFVVDEQPLLVEGMYGGPFGGDGSGERDAYGRDPAANQLAAYELATGRELWRVGGGTIETPYRAELSGWFFRGAPVSSENELLVIGEKKGEIRLLALNPANGGLEWSQLLGFSTMEVGKDGIRQRLSGEPIVAEGVIVCPTLTGWIVAIDRLTRSIVWYHRTKPTDQEGRETPFVDLSGLSGGWGGMHLQSSRGVVLSTSFDGKRLLCLSLIDGRERWGMSSAEPAYAAGVCDKGVVIVSRKSIYCLGLEEKETAWKLKLDAKDVPGGRGALGANGMLYVPTNEGGLLKVDCNEGKIVGRERIEPARGDELGLGNLVLTENELVGVNGEEIRTFETRQSMESAERSRNVSSLSEAQKRILEGERLVGEKKYGEAWSVLRSIERDQLTADQRKGLDERERLVLLTGLKEGGEYDAWRAYLQEKLFDEKTSGGKRIGDWELGVAGARWLEGIGKKEEAWGLLLRLIADEGLETELIVESDQPRYEVRADLVAAGLLKRIWEQSSEEERKRLDEMPATQQEFAGGSDVEKLERRLRLFGFHSLAREWRKDLFQQLFTAGEFHRAEGVLLKELAELDRQFAEDLEKEKGAVVEQLAGLMVLAGVPEDAEWYRKKYGIKIEEQSGESSGDLLKWGSRAPNWKGEELQMSVEGGIGNGYPPMEIPIREAAAPSARRWRWQIAVLQQRLLARSNETERIEWGVPLRNRDPILELRGRSWIDGHLTAVELGGMLQGVSILDRKLLWSVPTSSEGNYDAEMFYTEDGPVFPMHPVHILPLKNMNLRQHLPVVYNGPKMGVAAKSSSRLCLRERGGVVCLDSMTGRTMWRLQGVSNETAVIGGEEVVYLIHPNRLDGEARRMEDGSRLRNRETGEPLELKRLLGRTVSVSGGDLIVRGEVDAEDISKKEKKGAVPLSLRGPLEDGLRTKALLEKSGLLGNGKGGTVRLSRYRPETGEMLWSTEIPGGAFVGEVSAGNLLVIDEAGVKEERVWNVRMLSMRDGAFRSLGTMNPQPIRSLHQGFMRIYAHQAGGMLFLGASQGNDDMYSEDLVSMMDVNGPFGVFDLDQGKPLWQMTIRSTKLVLDKLERSPVLIFTEKSAPLGGTGGWKRDVRVVDRFTGREMLNEQITSDDQLIQVEIDTRDRGVRLVCSGEVLRLRRGE